MYIYIRTVVDAVIYEGNPARLPSPLMSERFRVMVAANPASDSDGSDVDGSYRSYVPTVHSSSSMTLSLLVEARLPRHY